LFDDLMRRGQVALQYVEPDGATAGSFPGNPNASRCAAAGLSDASGRVLAMMPHPERAAWLLQVPDSLPGLWGDRRRAAADFRSLVAKGPGQVLYDGLVEVASEAMVRNA
jgi:phosphoribosylformylglycinamidine (FGAM) synthase-like amidotransferase family enzyme